MKKMIFSAVALVAFSFAGMANNKAGEPTKKVEEAKKEVAITENADALKLHPCVFVGFAMADAVEQNGGTPAQITAAAEIGYNLCMAFMP